MIYTIWSIINIGLFIYLLYITAKSVKLVYRNLGAFASVILVIGILSILSNTNADYSQNGQKDIVNSFEFVQQDNVNLKNVKSKKIVIDSTITSKRVLFLTFMGKKNNNSYLPVRAYTNEFGLQGATKWNIESLNVFPIENTELQKYQISGLLEWHILGLSFYKQIKEYEGTIEIKEL